MATTDTHRDGIHQLVTDGLKAIHAATESGQKAADKILAQATHPALRAELERGTQVSAGWRDRVAHVQQALGTAQDEDGVLDKLSTAAGNLVGPSDSAIIDAIHKTGQEAASHAKDDASRDLGIIAAGQLALHYYIAAFGTSASYLEHIGRADLAATLKQCASEAGDEDERHTQIARQIMQGA